MTNVARLAATQKYKLDEDFELSQSYLFFWDSLSKSNWVLEQILDLAEKPLDDRTIQYLLTAPQGDGGQFDMAVNVVETFGLVPQARQSAARRSSRTASRRDLAPS